ATPTRAPTRVNTPRPPLVVPTTEVVVPTFPPRTGTPSAVTTPTPNRDSPLALAQQFDGKAALAHTRYLTLHELAGRKAGAPGADKAADYIAEKFKAAGLKPVGDNGTYFQNFTLPFIDLAEAPTLRLLNADGLVKRQFKHRVEFSEVIGGRAGDGQAEGRLVFVGRGTKADLDLAGDLQNTVALMAPAPTTPRDLITQLSARGVLGIIQVTGNAANLQVRFSYIPDSLIRDGQRAVVRVSREVADELLFGSGATLQELEDKLNRDGMAFLATPNRVSMSVKLVPIRDAPTKNVVGALIGSDPTLANEVYIVGGHYDHVGVDPDGAVFEGANDNASGTAVTVALAEFFAQHAIKPKRTIVFAAWTGEEAGLVGSQYYVDHPIFPLAQTKGYINLDVVGAGSGEGLTITNDSPTIGGAARRSATDLGVVFGGGAIGGGSDHESFAKAGVAATFFIWQRYGDIHVPGDTFDKIEVEKLRATGQVAALTLMRLAEIGK
ncbi:MAG: M28 family peptidase, partial [Chloroflexota bacterium]